MSLSVFDRGAAPPCPAPFNLAAHVLAPAERAPDRIALAVLAASGAERWSFGRLRETVSGTAGGLLAQGLAPGDRILMRLGNTVDFPVAFLACVAAGLVPVPTSAELTGPEASRLAEQVAPALVLHDPSVACPEGPGLRVMTLDALRALRHHAPADFALGDPDRLAYIVFTSGTSGAPRGVMHAHRAIWARRMMHGDWYGLTPEDRLMHAGAFNWTYTLGTGLLDPWSLGATALIPAPGTETRALPLLMRRHDVTIFAASPGIYRRVLRHHPKMDLPRLRHGLSAGEKLPEPLRTAWQEATGTPLFEAYGMSECSTFISSGPGHPAAPGALGRPQRGRRVAVLGEDGAPVPLGEPGTIAVARRDPGLMLGYLGAEAESRERQRGEWFLTGDRGTMDAAGEIVYLGRGDDMMNAGGTRVSPIEVETALADHPGIEAVAAADVEVRPGVRVIAAFYTGPATLDETELAAFAARRLARYKQPRIWVHRAALPTGPNGKLLRRRLRDEWRPAPPRPEGEGESA